MRTARNQFHTFRCPLVKGDVGRDYGILLNLASLAHDHALEPSHVTLFGGNLKVSVDDA